MNNEADTKWEYRVADRSRIGTFYLKRPTTCLNGKLV